MWQYRSATDEDDLEALFRLRYRAFSASETLHDVVAASSRDIDVTAWDLLSVHYGVFADGVPIAAIRAVGGERTLQSDSVQALTERLGIVLAHAGQPALRYPMFEQLASQPLMARVASQRGRGLRVVECGRLCIAPGLDRASRVRALRFLAECTLAAELLVGRSDVIYGLSPPELARMYRAYGFQRVKEAGEVLAFSTRVRGVVSAMTRQRLLEQPLAPRLHRFSEELRGSGSVRRGELLIGAA